MRLVLLLLAVCYSSADVSHLDRKYLPPSRTSDYSASTGYPAAVPALATFNGKLPRPSNAQSVYAKPAYQQLRTEVVYTNQGFPSSTSGLSGQYSSSFPATSSNLKTFSPTDSEQKVSKLYQAPTASFTATPAKLTASHVGQYVAPFNTQTYQKTEALKSFETPQAASTFGTLSSTAYKSSPTIFTASKYTAPSAYKTPAFDQKTFPDVSGALTAFGTLQATPAFGTFDSISQTYKSTGPAIPTTAKYSTPSAYSTSSVQGTFDKKTPPVVSGALRSFETPQTTSTLGTLSSTAYNNNPAISTAAKYTAPSAYKTPAFDKKTFPQVSEALRAFGTLQASPEFGTFDTITQTYKSTEPAISTVAKYSTPSAYSTSFVQGTFDKKTSPVVSGALRSFGTPQETGTFGTIGSTSYKNTPTISTASKYTVQSTYSEPLVESFNKKIYPGSSVNSESFDKKIFPVPSGALKTFEGPIGTPTSGTFAKYAAPSISSAFETVDKRTSPVVSGNLKSSSPYLEAFDKKYFPGGSAAIKSLATPQTATTFGSFGTTSFKSNAPVTSILHSQFSNPIVPNKYSAPLVETFEKKNFYQQPTSSQYEVSQFNSQKPITGFSENFKSLGVPQVTSPFGAFGSSPSTLLTSDKYSIPTTGNTSSSRLLQTSQLKFKPGSISPVETFNAVLSSKPSGAYRNSASFSSGSRYETKYASNGGYSY